jgi:F1F0 ATPase subunit 2
MTAPDTAAFALPAVAGLAAGLALGAVYFLLLHAAVRRLAGDGPAARAVPLHVARLALALAGFWGLAQYGAVPLLAGLVGFLLSRYTAQRLLPEG